MKIIVKSEIGREVNPKAYQKFFCDTWTKITNGICIDLTKCDCEEYRLFEQSVTYHPAPGIADCDEVEANLQYQFYDKHGNFWTNCSKRTAELYCEGIEVRQIWVVSPSQKVEAKEGSSLMSEDEFQKKWAFPRSSFDFSNPVTFTKSVQALMHLKEDERKILEELIWMWEENRFKK